MPLSEAPHPSLAEGTPGSEPPLLRTSIPGPRSRALARRLAAVENPAFASRRDARGATSGADQTPIVYASAFGANVVDVDGNRFVDLAAGFGAIALGHGATRPAAALSAQSERLVQGLGDLYPSDAKIALLERLALLFHPTEGARVMLGQSGADAVTAALKTAVLATGRAGVIALEGSYHGLSYAPLAACGYQPSFREPFARQLGAHVTFVPFPRDPASLAECLSRIDRALASGDIGAVLFEPVLGRGGCVPMHEDAMPSIVARARAHGALTIADEIWTGLGRSGAMWLSEPARPDMVLLGKALGGGLPLSACVAREGVMDAWARGGEVVHTATFHGAPLACATALGTLDALRAQALPARAALLGESFRARLRDELGDRARDVRGVGLLVGVELDDGGAAGRSVRSLLREGYIATTGGRQGEVVIFTPPLTITEPLLDAAAAALARSV